MGKRSDLGSNNNIFIKSSSSESVDWPFLLIQTDDKLSVNYARHDSTNIKMNQGINWNVRAVPQATTPSPRAMQHWLVSELKVACNARKFRVCAMICRKFRTYYLGMPTFIISLFEVRRLGLLLFSKGVAFIKSNHMSSRAVDGFLVSLLPNAENVKWRCCCQHAWVLYHCTTTSACTRAPLIPWSTQYQVPNRSSDVWFDRRATDFKLLWL